MKRPYLCNGDPRLWVVMEGLADGDSRSEQEYGHGEADQPADHGA